MVLTHLGLRVCEVLQRGQIVASSESLTCFRRLSSPREFVEVDCMFLIPILDVVSEDSA